MTQPDLHSFVKHFFIVFWLSFAVNFSLCAQSEKGSTGSVIYTTYVSHQLGYSSSQRYNAYLSPLKYKGAALFYRMRTEFPLSQQKNRWLVSSEAGFGWDRLLNAAHSAQMTVYTGNFALSVHHLKPLANRLMLGVGSRLEWNTDVMLQSRNQNNPNDIEVNLDLQPSFLLAYEMQIGRFACRVRLDTYLSLLGIGFCTDYRESYWQAILLKRLSQSIEFHSLHNRMQLASQLTLDFPIANVCTLQFAYKWQTSGRLVNNLYKQNASHYLGVGISTHLQFFPGYRIISNNRYANPLYSF